MKYLLIIATSFTSFSALATNAPVTCAKEAYRQISEDMTVISRLCAGAISNAPVTCAKEAYRQISEDMTVISSLCSGTK